MRGLTRPYPGAFTYHKGEQIHVWRARPSGSEAVIRTPDAPPGATFQKAETAGGSGVLVKCGDGWFLLVERVSVRGQEMDAAEAVGRGFIVPGEVLGGN